MLRPAQRPGRASANAPREQRGVVLLIALIVLVALTLAGVALIRSVDTGNLIAGNLSFQQSAIQSGEKGAELAITNGLQAAGADLNQDNAANAYFAARQDPAANVSWDDFWKTLPFKTFAQDAAGNTVSYVIHRLCDGAGAPSGGAIKCSLPPNDDADGASQGGGNLPAPKNIKIYYRITTRIVGPRKTVAYVQTIVAQ